MRGFAWFAFLFGSAAFALSCAKAAPASSPFPSEPPVRAWLTLEENGKFAGWTEIAGDLSQEILMAAPLPKAPDAMRFSPTFLAETSVSADGVTIVRRVGEPFAHPLREKLNALLREKGRPALSRREFEAALQRSQLTCHATWTTAEFSDDGTPIPGEYACVGELECRDNLLFSLTPPENQDAVLANLSLLGVVTGRETMACREDLEDIPLQLSDPWLVTWGELLPILQGVTSMEETDTKQRGVCAGNMSSEGVNMARVVVAARALTRFAGTVGGMGAFLALVAGSDSAPSLWEDPCFPSRLEPFLAEENIMLLGKGEFQWECEASGGSLASRPSPDTN